MLKKHNLDKIINNSYKPKKKIGIVNFAGQPVNLKLSIIIYRNTLHDLNKKMIECLTSSKNEIPIHHSF